MIDLKNNSPVETLAEILTLDELKAIHELYKRESANTFRELQNDGTNAEKYLEFSQLLTRFTALSEEIANLEYLKLGGGLLPE